MTDLSHMPVEAAERRGDRGMTDAEQTAIEARAEELLAERFADPVQFADLMSGIDSTAIDRHLHTALLVLDTACAGSQPHIASVLRSLHLIQRVIKAEMKIVWRADCVERAERGQ